ncbi:hypothetical protein EES46_20335 [Streptomyces sp. ADI98-10]|nr:hypothetical protein EES46_20335 [Streptomyces sp. ADI98-10]
MTEIALRAVQDSDLPLFFAWMSDPEATRVAAFTSEDPTDRAAFDAHWARLRAGSGGVVMRTVVADGAVVGHVGAYGDPGDRQVTYWIGRAHWAADWRRPPCGRSSTRRPRARCTHGRRPTTSARAGCWRSAASW